MVIELSREVYFHLLEECNNARGYLCDCVDEIKDIAVNSILLKHCETLTAYFDYLMTFPYSPDDDIYRTDLFEFCVVLSTLVSACPFASVLCSKFLDEPIV